MSKFETYLPVPTAITRRNIAEIIRRCAVCPSAGAIARVLAVQCHISPLAIMFLACRHRRTAATTAARHGTESATRAWNRDKSQARHHPHGDYILRSRRSRVMNRNFCVIVIHAAATTHAGRSGSSSDSSSSQERTHVPLGWALKVTTMVMMLASAAMRTLQARPGIERGRGGMRCGVRAGLGVRKATPRPDIIRAAHVSYRAGGRRRVRRSIGNNNEQPVELLMQGCARSSSSRTKDCIISHIVLLCVEWCHLITGEVSCWSEAWSMARAMGRTFVEDRCMHSTIMT